MSNLYKSSKLIKLGFLLCATLFYIPFQNSAFCQQRYGQLYDLLAKENDKKKVEAAKYLVLAIPGKSYYRGEHLNNFEQLFKMMEEIKKVKSIGNNDIRLQSKLDSLIEEFGTPSVSNLETVQDSATLTIDFLRENLDYAFKVKAEKAWLKEIPDEVFFEYVLPYRVANESLEEHQREKLYNRYNFIKKSSKSRQESFDRLKSTDQFKFASDVQYEISRVISTNGTMWGYPFDISVSKMEQGGQGACRHLVDYTTAAMRSVGLPVARDFCVRWGNNRTGHKWNVLFLEDGNEMPFDAASSSLSFDIGDRKVVKVYRERFSNTENLVSPNKADVPSDLFNPSWQDVTHKYTKVADIAIKVPKKIRDLKSYVLIGTFDNVRWQPQHYAEVTKDGAVFKRMGIDNVYIGMYQTDGKTLTFGDPFRVDSLGKVTYLPANSGQIDLTVSRKYPRTSWIKDFESTMVGGKFELSDNKDFLGAKFEFLVEHLTDSVAEFEVPPGQYRFLKYTFPKLPKAYLAEISASAKGEPIELFPLEPQENTDILKAIDQDLNSYYWGGEGKSLIYDMKQMLKIDRIGYVPRSDSNFIILGNEYELCVWQNGTWVSIGSKIATSSSLKFKNVPGNGLYIVHNLTQGIEERVFTYNNGVQIWW